MAEHHQRRTAGAQRVERLRHAAHGNQLRLVYLRLLMLKRFPYVHQAHWFTGIEAPL
jgi:hypothetical protein